MNITSSLLRNILGILCNIDRHHLPAMSDREWTMFRDDPYRSFLHFRDDLQEQIAAVVALKIKPSDTRTQDEKDYEFDRLLGR